MTTTLHLRGPADVLAVLPYQLGYHPRDSVLVVSLHGRRMGLVQRLDLPPHEHLDQAVAAMTGPLAADGPESALLVGYEDAEGASSPMLDALDDACDEMGLPVADRLVVREGRWFALDCTSEACCPTAGTLLQPGHEVPAVADFVGMEVAPLVDREALVASLQPGSHPLLTRAVRACAQEWLQVVSDGHDEHQPDLEKQRARALAVWAELLREDDAAPAVTDLPPGDLALAACSLVDVHLRDALVAWLCPGTLELDLVDPGLREQLRRFLPVRGWGRGEPDVAEVTAQRRVEARLVALCGVLPDEWAVAALTVLANLAWWRGDGALTRVALDRALAVDPGYRLAALLERMVDLAIRPDRASA
ncbi:MAG: DUF4192 domain-containing protein [Oryzihumus sp.]